MLELPRDARELGYDYNVTDSETARNHPEASNADRADDHQPAPDRKAALNAMDDHQWQAGGVNRFNGGKWYPCDYYEIVRSA